MLLYALFMPLFIMKLFVMNADMKDTVAILLWMNSGSKESIYLSSWYKWIFH